MIYIKNTNTNEIEQLSQIPLNYYGDEKETFINENGIKCQRSKLKDEYILLTESDLEVQEILLEDAKKTKILEAKAKREEKLSNFVVDEGIIEAKNRAETVLILEGYKNMLDQNITLAEYGLKDGKLVKLTKPIIDKWLLTINTQYNQAWLDYRDIKNKIDNAETILTLNKIEIK